jgi:dolichyl-phosphate-mannose-protein mannosyltransferase
MEMISASARIEQRHAWESVWWEWPLNIRGVLYYSKAAGHTYTESVYLLGNPLVLWPLLVILIVAFLSVAFYARYRTDNLWEWWARKPLAHYFSAATFCLIVYVLNLMPYVAVKRSCFIYHYMPALMYAEIVAGLVLDQFVSKRWRGIALQALAFLAVAGFVFFAPWVYAFRMYYI